MKRNAMVIALAAAGLVLAGTACADTTYSFSGFGTLGATHSDNREIDFVGSIVQPGGAGRSKAISTGIDSKAGVQAVAKIGNDLTGTFQVVADRRFDNTYAPRFEWANLKYQISKEAYVRAGRVVAPVFMVSDYRNVGYAQTMVRMPYDVYSQNPISHMDGIDVGYQFEFAGGTLGFSAVAGQIKEFVPGSQAKGNGKLLSMTFEKGYSTFRIGALKDRVNAEMDVNAQVDMLNDALTQYGYLVGRPGPVIPHRGIEMRLLDVGYLYDNGSWLAQAEYVSERGGWQTVKDTDSWYLMAGYRLGKFTPYIGFSRLRDKEPAYPAPAAATLPIPVLQTLADAVNLIDVSIKPAWEQKTISLGLRYDFYKNVAAKLQYDRIHKPGSPTSPVAGMFKTADTFGVSATSFAPWQVKDINVNLMTVTLDFVF